MYLRRSGRAWGSLAWSPLGQAASLLPTFTVAERQAVKVLIDQEVHNENALTDKVFFRRHPRRTHPLRGGPELVPSEKVEWTAIRDRLVRPMLTAVPITIIPSRPCCLLGPAPAQFVDPSRLGAHKDSSEVRGILYTGRAGFIDLGHLLETCDLTEFAWTRLQGSGGLPVVIPTIHGEATITRPVPRNRWVVVAQAIANDDALGHEIWTYDMHHGPGLHNSAFSPEDLCSNFVGTVVGRLAIGEGGVFPRKVDAKLASVLKSLLAQPLTETQQAFNKIKTKWVNFVDDTSWRKDDYLRRRNFTRRPFKVGHPSDAPTPAWVLASFGDAETFYTYKHTLGKTIPKTSFAAEIQRIRVDARARYGDQFDQP